MLESVCLLETNIDDCSPEAIGHCVEQLWSAGVLDVSVLPIQMKKSRPGVLLAIQCRPSDTTKMQEILFQQTTTLGIRETLSTRYVLPRRTLQVMTPWGEIAGIERILPDGSPRFSPEYEACRNVADAHGVPLADVQAVTTAAYLSRQNL